MKPFSLPPGRNVEPGSVRGYYVDYREKTAIPSWPPGWFPYPGFHRFMAVAQWGLGCFERYLDGDGEEWLSAASAACEHLVETQISSPGPRLGGWAEPFDYPQTFRVRGPWLSALTQAQCASLLVRVFLETGEDRFAETALAGLAPMSVPVGEGGVQGRLDEHSYPEEYPTAPASHVLNGGIFSVLGYYDVAVGLSQTEPMGAFRDGVDALAVNIRRWDTGYWSRYDLYPHPVVNVASPWYHTLHISLLRALDRVGGSPELRAAAERFEIYARSPVNRSRAVAAKMLFRLLVPKTPALARRLPWSGAKEHRE